MDRWNEVSEKRVWNSMLLFLFFALYEISSCTLFFGRISALLILVHELELMMFPDLGQSGNFQII